MNWLQRREIANKIYKYTDNNLDYTIDLSQSSQQLVNQVLSFFNSGSELVYPAKYIFCNIVYSYFLNKYFGLDFYTQLNDKNTLIDSPIYCLYSDYKEVYDQVLDIVLPNIEQNQHISKTRKYFKQEFLIADEDLSDIL